MSEKNNCIIFRKLLSAYIDNETTHIESENITDHISICPSCKIELSNLYKMRDMIKNTYVKKYEVDFSSNIMGRVKFSQKKEKHKKNFFKVMSYGSIAAVLLLVLTATIFYSQSKTKALLAEKRKFDTYVVEHTKEFSDKNYKKSDNSSFVISVNFEK